MEDKKGLAVGFIVLIILGLVVGAVIIVITGIFGLGITEGFAEGFCIISSATRHRVPFPDLCETSLQFVEPDNTLKCPAVAKEMQEDSESFTEAEGLQLCTAEQIYQLAGRCWSQRGRGNFNPGDFTCYFACIGSSQERVEIPTFGAEGLVEVGTLKFQTKTGEEVSYASILPSAHMHVIEYVLDPDVIYTSSAVYVAGLAGGLKTAIPSYFLTRDIAGKSVQAVAGEIRSGEFIKIEFVDDKDHEDDDDVDYKDLILISSFGASCAIPSDEEVAREGREQVEGS